MISKLKLISSGLAVASLFFTFATFSSVNSAHALTCKNKIVTHTTWARSALTYGKARKRARIKWRAAIRVTPGYGWKWSNWDKARDKSYKCKKTGRWKNWRKCKAYARPCK